jgi:cellulose synthase/poly-beta-1,6-N-acetylglucosamine synthase-like glycosyltransferase
MLTGLLHLLLIIAFAIVLAWSLYNALVFFTGLFSWFNRKANKASNNYSVSLGECIPFVSIIIPVKNGERVLPRLMDSLLNLDYPKDRMEIILVEDGSCDNSYNLCLEYARKYPGLIRVLHRDESRGKPDALNFALKHASGDILAFFDVDSIVERDSLKRAIELLNEPNVAAIQQRTASLNHNQNILTRLICIEETCSSIILEGRNVLKLFIPLTGSCMFIKRSAIEKVGGWNAESLTEDAELSVRLLKEGFIVIYDKEVGAYQEAPASLRSFIKQRMRWYRGLIETFAQSLNMVKNLGRKFIDAIAYLASPLMVLLSQFFYCSLAAVVLLGYNSPLLQIIFQISLVSLLLFVASLASFLLKFVNWRLNETLLASCLIFCYWFFIAFIVLISLLNVLLGTRREWYTTTKGEYGCVSHPP